MHAERHLRHRRQADTVERFGRMRLADVLAPAIALAEEGLPVQEVVARGAVRH